MSSQSLHVQFAESLATPPSDRPRMDGVQYPKVAQKKGARDRLILDLCWELPPLSSVGGQNSSEQETAPQTGKVAPPMTFSETLNQRLTLTYEAIEEETHRQEQPNPELNSEYSSWGTSGTGHLSVIMPSTCNSSGSSEAGSYPVTPADDEKPQYLGGACNKSQQSSRTLSF